ncbi:uncharacterized protein TNCV_409001 [Trichonephila clavipes]|nr:uncharacterized protein TNCV_409001 [Trichonephila clavipes]
MEIQSPTTASWGGWWERLIRILKDLLKRVLGHARLNYEEMTTESSGNFTVSVGEIVIVGADNKKKIIWPLGHITEIIPGKDGQVQLVRVQTSQKEFLHPIQRIYPLEISSSDNLSALILPEDLKKSNDISKTLDCTSGSDVKFSRSRRIKVPERLNL